MADFPALSPLQVTPLFIGVTSSFSVGWEHRSLTGGVQPATVTWVTNLIAYMPLALPFSYPCKRVWWVNGATIASTNVDMGIYSGSGVQLFSTGATAMVGASTLQYATADILLPPGTYYLAWTCSNTTSRGHALSGTAIQGRLSGFLQQVAAIPLPATMTGASWAQAFGVPYCGLTRTASGF